MITTKYIDEYREMWKSGKIKFNKERMLLFKYLDKYILNRDDIYFDEEMLENYIKFTEKWYFELDIYQKFVASFVFLFYKKNDRAFYRRFLIMLGRGGGKNGFISSLVHFFISPLHPIENYNVSIIANSEDQAKTSFTEVYNTIKKNETLSSMFYKTKVQIEGNATGSILKFRTSNGNTKDGLRDGCVVFDEIHQFENNQDVRVHISGLGKVKNPREFYIGTDGYVREGFLDKQKEKALNVLNGKAAPDSMFPFICKLDSSAEVSNPENWGMANPILDEPRSEYAEGLFYTIMQEYRDLEDDPSNREEFMTKRMNIPEEDLSKSVATWEEILATNRPYPDLMHRVAVGGLDFASIKDFAAVGLLFKVGEDYIWKSHSFVRKGFLDTVKLKPPIKEWEADGLLTIVDEPVIDIKHIVNWFCEMRELYGVNRIVADTFRLDLVKSALEAEGFELIYIRNPRAIHAKLAPRVETLFATGRIIFGDNPLMRWYTNNIAVKIDKYGNKTYEKKDEIRRKTDGFQAFIHALWQADNVFEEEIDFVLNTINF